MRGERVAVLPELIDLYNIADRDLPRSKSRDSPLPGLWWPAVQLLTAQPLYPDRPDSQSGFWQRR